MRTSIYNKNLLIYTETMASPVPVEMVLFTGIVLIALWIVYRLYIAFILNKTEGFASGSITETSNYKFVMYYADWCGHCHHAKPEFSKLGAKQTIGGKQVDVVAINPEKNPEAVEGKNIRGYPTIHLYDPKGVLLQEFEGSRTQDSFQSFLAEHVK